MLPAPLRMLPLLLVRKRAASPTRALAELETPQFSGKGAGSPPCLACGL